MSKQSELDEILIELINRIELCADVPGSVSIGREREYAAYTEAKLAILDWHQQEIARVRLNEAQTLYEDAINSTSHGHITYARKRVERHLETLKELEAEL